MIGNDASGNDVSGNGMGELVGVYTDLHSDPILVTEDVEEAVERAESEFHKAQKRVWVLDAKRDIYAYVDADGVERF